PLVLGLEVVLQQLDHARGVEACTCVVHAGSAPPRAAPAAAVAGARAGAGPVRGPGRHRAKPARWKHRDGCNPSDTGRKLPFLTVTASREDPDQTPEGP